MPRGDKSAYTEKQKRQAEHIEESERERGASESTAERIAWATVNKQDGGGKRSGSGRKVAKEASAKKATRKAAAKKTTAKKAPARKTATKKATKKTVAKKASTRLA
ncbi:hypothetical protein A7X75_07335 [Stenotrophomonas maltophilia]|nr:hypothetical protein A7X75_07335 [Stenotrophomonas maltophilia]